MIISLWRKCNKIIEASRLFLKKLLSKKTFIYANCTWDEGAVIYFFSCYNI